MSNKYYYKIDINFDKKEVAQVNGLIDKLIERFENIDYTCDKKSITFEHTGDTEKKVKYNLKFDTVLYVECDDPIIRARYEYRDCKVVDEQSYLNFFEAGSFWL